MKPTTFLLIALALCACSDDQTTTPADPSPDIIEDTSDVTDAGEDAADLTEDITPDDTSDSGENNGHFTEFSWSG